MAPGSSLLMSNWTGPPRAWARALGLNDDTKGTAVPTTPAPPVTRVATVRKCRRVKPVLVSRGGAGATPAKSSYAQAVAASAPAVANIYTEKVLGTARNLPGITLRGRGLGSGVVIDPRGYIVTNWHVIDGADQVRV